MTDRAQASRQIARHLPLREAITAAGRRVVATIDRAAAFAESWPGIALGWGIAAALAWYRWPALEAMT